MKKRDLSLRNLTPKSLQCVAIGCPAIYEAKDNSYIIIGRIACKSAIEELGKAISEGEVAIQVPKKLFNNLKAKF